jgi:hypothetical protein
MYPLLKVEDVVLKKVKYIVGVEYKLFRLIE